MSVSHDYSLTRTGPSLADHPSQTMSIVLIDASSTSLTVSWPGVETEDAVKYILQYRRSSDDPDTYQTLSEGLTTTQARKKNLVDENHVGFFFRVQPVHATSEPSSWRTHSEPFHLLSETDDRRRLPAPNVSVGGTHQSLLVRWTAAADGPTGYELQMRENIGGAPWRTIADHVAGTEVRKRNLTAEGGYQFRVRPVASQGPTAPFSAPSDPVVALGLSQGISHLFRSLAQGTLLRSDAQVPLSDALGGKEFVLLYASAHWCGPCRQATPLLANWYQSLGANRTMEVVFLSADHDERSFREYYRSMPWLAVDYEDDTREQLMGFLRVQGIPQLAVLDGRTGRLLEKNAIGKPFDMSHWRSLASASR